MAERAERAKRVGRAIVPAVALLPVTSSGSHHKECTQEAGRAGPPVVRQAAAAAVTCEMTDALDEVKLMAHQISPVKYGGVTRDRLVIIAIAIGVFGDMASVQVGFEVFDLHVGLSDGGLAVAQAFDLCALEDNARLKGVADGVVMACPLIARDDFFLTVFKAGHRHPYPRETQSKHIEPEVQERRVSDQAVSRVLSPVRVTHIQGVIIHLVAMLP